MNVILRMKVRWIVRYVAIAMVVAITHGVYGETSTEGRRCLIMKSDTQMLKGKDAMCYLNGTRSGIVLEFGWDWTGALPPEMSDFELMAFDVNQKPLRIKSITGLVVFRGGGTNSAYLLEIPFGSTLSFVTAKLGQEEIKLSFEDRKETVVEQ